MSRLLAEIGIGVADAALIVDAHAVTPGQLIDVRLEIEGGARDQRVDELVLGLATETETDRDSSLVDFGRETITEPFTVPARATKTIESTARVPIGTPVTTVGETPVWVTAGLDIEWAPDPVERTALDVTLPPVLQTVLETLDGESLVCLGATCRSADILPVATRYDFLQVFDFHPRGGHYDRDIGTLEVIPTYSPDNSDRIDLVLVRDVQSGRSAVDHLDSNAVERTRVSLTTETTPSEIRKQALDALDDLLP